MDVVSEDVAPNRARLVVRYEEVDAGRIVAAFTDPDVLVAWWPETAQTEPVVGGSYHLAWEAMGWHLRGEYRSVGERNLSFTWAWDHDDLPSRTVAISATDGSDGVEVAVEHSAGSTEEARSYLDGWLHFLPRLGERLRS